MENIESYKLLFFIFWKTYAMICEVFELENAEGCEEVKAFLFECLVILVLYFGKFFAL